jgi:hypothetical protein
MFDMSADEIAVVLAAVFLVAVVAVAARWMRQ